MTYLDKTVMHGYFPITCYSVGNGSHKKAQAG